MALANFDPMSASASDLPWLVLPFRSLADGKQRLAGFLADRERYALNLEMLRRSLRLAGRYPGRHRTIVVTRCAEARALAQAAGASAVLQRAQGLDDAARLGMSAAAAQGAGDLLVVSCDLPLARPGGLQQLCRLGRSTGSVVLATDRWGQGTNALYLPAGIQFRFAYGAGSRKRHARAAAAAGLPFQVLEDSPLAFDVDTPDDYLTWRTVVGKMSVMTCARGPA